MSITGTGVLGQVIRTGPFSAEVILITDAEGAGHIGHGVAETIIIPKVLSFVAPILALIPVQLLAYHTAVFMGTDVDQPRNLAKSVTVE